MKNKQIYRYSLLVLITVISALIFTKYLIKKELSTEIHKAGYEFTDIDLNIVFGNLEIIGLSNKGYTLDLDSIEEYCLIDRVRIEGFSYWNHFVNSRISMDYASIENGNISFLPKNEEVKDSNKSKPIEIERFVVDSVQLNLIGENKTIRWKRGKVLLSKLSIDTLSIDKRKDVHFHLNELICQEIEYQHSLNLHKISTASIESNENEVTLKNLIIEPLKSKSNFAKNIHGKKEMFDLQTETLVFTNLNWSTLVKSGKIEADKLQINESNFNIFSNENVPRIKPKSYKALPTIRTLKSNLKYKILEIEINNAFINYERLAKEKKEAGNLFWENINAKVINITNDSIAITESPLTKFDIDSKFMGEAKLQLYATFDLTSPKSEYEVNLTLDKMSMQPFNQILEDVSGVRIKEGDIQSLNVNFKANENDANGDLNLIYDNLKVRMLNGNDKESNNPLKWIGSRLLIRKNNNGTNAKVGVIELERDQTASIWHQLWTSIFDGFKSIVFPEFMNSK